MVDKKIITLSIIAVAIIFVLIIVNSTSNFTGLAITNPIKTCRNVEVPYPATEEYQVPLKYEVVSATKDTTLHGFDVWATSDVVVRNVDTETGTFIVTQTFKTLNKPPQTLERSQYVMPAEMKTFHQEFDISIGEDFNVEYIIDPSEKTLTRTVTKYRTEERCD